MKRLLILGGTTEGRVLAEHLSQLGHQVTVSVATDYGAELLEGLAVETHVGRLNQSEMEHYFKGFDEVIDATHPYAVEVSRNAAAAAERVGVKRQRLLRPEGSEEGWWQSVEDMGAAITFLEKTAGNVLLTTGSKDLALFSSLNDYQKRLWVRILPSHESLSLALEAGIPSSHIIAMQGPFSAQLNEALMRQFNISIMVTKRSGRNGGFAEKVQAVRAACGTLLVVERPEQESGFSLEELIERYKI